MTGSVFAEAKVWWLSLTLRLAQGERSSVLKGLRP